MDKFGYRNQQMMQREGDCSSWRKYFIMSLLMIFSYTNHALYSSIFSLHSHMQIAFFYMYTGCPLHDQKGDELHCCSHQPWEALPLSLLPILHTVFFRFICTIYYVLLAHPGCGSSTKQRNHELASCFWICSGASIVIKSECEPVMACIHALYVVCSFICHH
jgi:hypothetical protein